MFLEILIVLLVDPGGTMLAERRGNAGGRGRIIRFTSLHAEGRQ